MYGQDMTIQNTLYKDKFYGYTKNQFYLWCYIWKWIIIIICYMIIRYLNKLICKQGKMGKKKYYYLRFTHQKEYFFRKLMYRYTVLYFADTLMQSSLLILLYARSVSNTRPINIDCFYIYFLFTLYTSITNFLYFKLLLSIWPLTPS